MFAKVVNRIRSRSLAQKSSMVPEQHQHQHQQQLEVPVVQVHIAPELLRWSDFSSPFPSVAIGGYTRFYEMHTISEPKEPCPFSLLLSQKPEPSPSSEIPPKSLLFDLPAPPPSCLPMILEDPSESLALKNLTSTTPPHSLKRRARRLLRTPSIERDFGGFLDSVLAATSTTAASDIHSVSSSDSHERSESNDSEFPITPSTSVEEDGNSNALLSTKLFDRLSVALDDQSESATRPISSISYCTAKSEI